MDIAGHKCFIFDLDGTLLASTHMWHDIYGAALARFGIAMPDDYVAHVNHLNIDGGTAYTAERFGIAGGKAAVEKVWRELAGDAYAKEVELTPHAKELLYAIKNAGKTLAIATALDRDLAEACLSRHGVWGLFDLFSGVGGSVRDKSTADVYLAVSEGLELSPAQCVVFEDGYEGAASAHGAGFFIAGVRDRYSGADADRMRGVCDRLEDDLGGYLADFASHARD